jgi:hypothetical protein
MIVIPTHVPWSQSGNNISQMVRVYRQLASIQTERTSKSAEFQNLKWRSYSIVA